MGIINLADTIKKQTDRILRQQRQNGTGAKTIVGNPSGPPGVSNPTADLEVHKTADDHTNYLTEARHDLLDHTGLPGCGGAESFTDLDDVPTAYTGQVGKVLAVNSAEDALEFITPSSGTSGAFDFGSITEAASYTWDWGGLT